MGEKWQGFQTKMQSYRNFLREEVESGKNVLTVLLDGYDVLCLRSSEGCQEAFDELGYKIVCGSERVCLGNCRVPKKWQTIHKCTKNYVNTGCIVGYTRDLFEMWDWILRNLKEKDDQICVSHYMDAFPEYVCLS
ncbi:hypothetical protein EBS02_11790 [bacterium]|nr:hypothetical protein [bacterium]